MNVRGAFLCVKAVLPQMRRQSAGSVINIASATALMGVPGFIHYVTSKSALIGFTRALAREVGASGIRANVVLPGQVETDEVRLRMSDGERQTAISMRSLARAQVPSDLHGTLEFLISDASSFVTGQSFVVDGGGVFT